MRTKKHSVGQVRPHPVLGNGNDFTNETFRTVVEMSQDEKSCTIDCEFICDSAELTQLVESGRASFLADFNCPSLPGSRRNFATEERKARFVVPTSDIASSVSVAAYVVANGRITGYSPAGMHPDYGGRKFKVLAHEILAQDEEGTKIFELDGGGDSFLKVRRSTDPSEKIAKWEESSDYFWVALPMEDFDNWILGKKYDPETEQHFALIFVFPAVVSAIERIRDEKRSDLRGDDAPRWAKSLFGKLKDLKVDLESCEPHEAAQKILELPIGRVLSNILRRNEQGE